VIQLDDVSVRFGHRLVLDRITLAIPNGARFGIIGPAAGGKSVLLKVMAGLVPPTSGRLAIDGVDVTGWSEERLAPVRARIGMLFQNYALFDFLSVADNVGFPLVQRGVPAAERDVRVDERLRAVGLGGRAASSPGELSGGMRKRVAFARAIAIDPDIVLCDEPSSGLDPVMSATLDELILELHRTLGMTFIIISHDTAEARKVADTIGMLASGKLVTFGPATQVFAENHPALDQFFTRATQGPIKVV
jgi:phospholipid/cholesterol/gamma-HCH transport system ATP-binding protein